LKHVCKGVSKRYDLLELIRNVYFQQDSVVAFMIPVQVTEVTDCFLGQSNDTSLIIIVER